ncbi:MAG: hypothetical protein AB8E82_10195 [Aureispira sp.]
MTFRIIILLATFFASYSFAIAQSGDLVVFTTDEKTIYIALDNKFQNKKATSNLKVTNIPEGDYWVTLFFDNDKKAVKSNVRILASKENSFVIDKNGDSWKLKAYSTVPLSQVGQASSSQMSVRYNREGVVVENMKSANELADSQRNATYDRVHGSIDDLKAKAEKNRRGQFSGSSGSVAEQETATTAPQMEEGTTIAKRYLKTDNADGTVSIVEEATTTIREIVTRNGQQQMRSRRSVAMTPTNFTCLPMEAANFKALLKRVEGMDKSQRLAAAQKEIKDACLTPGQIKAIGGLFEDKEALNLFAMAAQPTSADPNNFPYEVNAVAIAEEVIEQEPVAEEKTVATDAVEEENVSNTAKEEPVIKTKAELKAELKAAKVRERAERKAAKEKAKAERKAAKEKAKAEKAKK